MGNSDSQGKPFSPWKALFRPMLTASIALHGLVLMIPLAAPEATVEEEPAEEEVVDLAALQALQATKPSPAATPTPIPTSEAVAPSPSSIPTPVVAIPSPQPLAPSPAPTPIPEASPGLEASSSPDAASSPETAPSPTPTSTAAVPEAFQALTPEQLRSLQHYLEQIEASEASASGALGQTARAAQQTSINCGLFESYAQLFFTNCGESGVEPQRRSEIFSVEVVPAQRRNHILEHYQATFPEYTFEPVGRQYADGELYAMKADGNPVLYLNVVSVGLRGSTKIAVLWLHDPTQSADQAATNP